MVKLLSKEEVMLAAFPLPYPSSTKCTWECLFLPSSEEPWKTENVFNIHRSERQEKMKSYSFASSPFSPFYYNY